MRRERFDAIRSWKRTIVSGLAVVLLLAISAIAPALTSAELAFTDLGTLGGAQSFVAGINERGQVVGDSLTASGDYHAYLWEKGLMTDLGTLGGAQSFVAGINERGQVVGSSQTVSGEGHAFLWEKGVMTDLGTLGGEFSYALETNERGQIVGVSQTASGEFHAFLISR